MKIWIFLFGILLSACGAEPGTDDGMPAPSPTPTEETDDEGSQNKEKGEGDDSAEQNRQVETLAEVAPTPTPTPEPEPLEDLTEWTDPGTGLHWLVEGPGDVADINCPMGYDTPDVNDIQNAHDGGLADELLDRDQDVRAWTQNLSNGVVESWRSIEDPTVWQNTITDAAIFCVEQ